jgi:hypothetical protein
MPNQRDVRGFSRWELVRRGIEEERLERRREEERRRQPVIPRQLERITELDLNANDILRRATWIEEMRRRERIEEIDHGRI